MIDPTRILESVRIRPQTRDDITAAFGADAAAAIDTLLSEKKIREYPFAGKIFYKANDHADTTEIRS